MGYARGVRSGCKALLLFMASPDLDLSQTKPSQAALEITPASPNYHTWRILERGIVQESELHGLTKPAPSEKRESQQFVVV